MIRLALSRQRGLGQKGKHGVLPHLSAAEAFPRSRKRTGSLRASRLEEQPAELLALAGSPAVTEPRQVKAPQKCGVFLSPRRRASRARGRPVSAAMFGAGVGIGTLPKAPPVHPLVQPHPFSPFRGQGTPGAASAEQLGRAGGRNAAGGGGCLPGEHLLRHPAGKGRFKPQMRGLFSPSCHRGGLRLAVRLGTRSLLVCVCGR